MEIRQFEELRAKLLRESKGGDIWKQVCGGDSDLSLMVTLTGESDVGLQLERSNTEWQYLIYIEIRNKNILPCKKRQSRGCIY